MASKRAKTVQVGTTVDTAQLMQESGAADPIGGVKPSKPGKLPVPKLTHFHIGADPLRRKSEEIRSRQLVRQQGMKPSEITNEVLYQMLADILENQAILESRLQSLAQQK